MKIVRIEVESRSLAGAWEPEAVLPPDFKRPHIAEWIRERHKAQPSREWRAILEYAPS